MEESRRNPAQYYFATHQQGESCYNGGYWMKSTQANRNIFVGEKDKFNHLNDPDLFKTNRPSPLLVMDFKKQKDRDLLPVPRKQGNVQLQDEKPKTAPRAAKYKAKTQVHPIMDTKSLKSLFSDNLHKYNLYELNCL